jgi:hypothetical protein
MVNNSDHTMNICDDIVGQPQFALDSGGEHPVAITRIANTLKLNLASAASLTNTITLTNPPTRFRVQACVRDLTGEVRALRIGQVLSVFPQSWSRSLQARLNSLQTPATEWIEMPAIVTDKQPYHSSIPTDH